MKIPSYDDLERSIVDVHPRDTFDFAARLVQHAEDPVVRTKVAPDQAAAGDLFACLRARGPWHPGALLALARDFSPRLERYGDDAIVLDASGLGRLLGDAGGIGVELARTAADRGLKVHIALAPTQTAARLLAASAAEEPVVVISDVAAALAPLPLERLARLDQTPIDRSVAQPFQGCPSAHAKFFDVLRRWGLRTMGELAGLPPDEIAARFGAFGLAMHRLALGLDPRPLIPDPGVPRFVQSMELEWPVEELEPLSFVLARLLEPLALALERADRGAAAIRLDLRLTDKTTHPRRLQLPAAMRDARVLRTLLLLDLESHPPSAGIDVVTIEVDPAPGRIVQFSLLEHAAPSPETIATLTARLHALVGEDRCGSPVVVDSHCPDAFELRRFTGPTDPRTQGPGNPRPQGPSLRRFRPPVAIRVAMERSRPAHVPIDRKGMPGGAVTQCAGPWRSSGAWWDMTGQWDRDEWDVEFADGSVCRVFQVRDTGGWFMEGVLD